MSVIRCEGCSRLIDSDFDLECFVETGNMRRLHETVVLCESCRDKRAAEDEAEDIARGQCEAEAEARADMPNGETP